MFYDNLGVIKYIQSDNTWMVIKQFERHDKRVRNPTLKDHVYKDLNCER